jgi:hypothetical protein
MLHYKGLINEEPGIKAKPIGDSDKDIMETLMFYDDDLNDDSCDLVQERLEEHFKLEPEDVFVQVYYDKKDDRAIIGLTIFFDKKTIDLNYLLNINLNSKNIIKKPLHTLPNCS